MGSFLYLGRTTFSPPQFVLKKKNLTTHRFLPRFWLIWWPKNWSLNFLIQKPIFQLICFYKKDIRNLGEPIYGLKKTKKPPQKPKPTWDKKFTWAQICFFMNFQGEQKHLIRTLIIKSNYLIQILTVLVAYNDVSLCIAEI
jgi:hypothetical protein